MGGSCRGASSTQSQLSWSSRFAISLPHLFRILRQGDRQTCECRVVSNLTCKIEFPKVGPFPLSLSKPTDNKLQLDYIYYKQCVVTSKPPLWGWSQRGDFGCRGIGLLPTSSVSSSTYSAAFPRGRSLPPFICGTKQHFLEHNDRGTERGDRKVGQQDGAERLGSVLHICLGLLLLNFSQFYIL